MFVRGRQRERVAGELERCNPVRRPARVRPERTQGEGCLRGRESAERGLALVERIACP